MKFIIATFIIAASIIFSCNQKHSPATELKNSDTTTTKAVLIMSVTPDMKGVWAGLGRRVIVPDTATWKQKDSVTIKKEHMVDSVYYIPFFPSWQDTVSKVIYLDSLPGRNRVSAWWNIPKEYVRSGWNDADLATRELDSLIKKNKPKK